MAPANFPASSSITVPDGARALHIGPENAGLLFHRLFLTEDVVVLELSSTAAHLAGAKARRRRIRVFRPIGLMGDQFQLPPIAVADDRGTTTPASATSPQSLDPGWRAQFVTDRPLALSTAWLEIDGERVELPSRSELPEVRSEAVPPPPDPLKATLYRDATTTRGDLLRSRDGRPVQYTASVKSLSVTGYLSATDPMLAEVEGVSDAIAGRKTTGGLPDPWASLLGRSNEGDGPVGFLPIGVAVVNSADGWSVRFDTLTSEQRGFEVAVTVSPGMALLTEHPWASRLEQLCLRPVAIEWSGADDLGNWYLGVGDRFGPVESVSNGRVSFVSPLDPRARRLSLIATGERERAVVSVSLAGLEDAR